MNELNQADLEVFSVIGLILNEISKGFGSLKRSAAPLMHLMLE